MPTNQKRDRAADKRRRYLLEHGRPSRVTDAEFARVVAHVKDLHERGMGYPWIAELAGTHQSTVACTASQWRGKERGKATGMNRSSYDAIMSVEFTPAPNGRMGSRMPSIGAARRLQGLCALGFSLAQIAVELDCDRAALGKIVRQQRSSNYIHRAVYDRIVMTYEKLRDVNPRDVGGTTYSLGRAKGAAQRHGYAHPDLWDDDTIDDPDAHPEYTGECGRLRGVLIHLRDDIMPLCAWCQHIADTTVSTINPFDLYELVKEGFSNKDIAEYFDVRSDSVAHYTSVFKSRHILESANPHDMRGRCEICGPVALRSAGSRRATGETKLICYNAIK